MDVTAAPPAPLSTGKPHNRRTILVVMSTTARDLFRALRIILWMTVTLLGLIYLVAIPVGLIGNNRLGVTEIALLLLLLVFSTGSIDRVATEVFDRVRKVSVGASGIAIEISDVKKALESQGRDIEVLKFLMAYFADKDEYQCLEGLASPADFAYEYKTDDELNEMKERLRRLANRALIKRQPDKRIGDLPRSGNVKQYCELTDLGKSYIRIRRDSDLL